VQTDPTLRARLDALERSDDDIAEQYPPEWLADRLRARLMTPRPASGGLRRLALGSAFAAAVALIVSALPVIQTAPKVFDLRAGDRRSRKSPGAASASRDRGAGHRVAFSPKKWPCQRRLSGRPLD
jgi:hypothetical protein